MLTGIELFQHRFSGNPENQCFFLKSEKLNRFQVPSFRTIFGDFFFENACIELFLVKIYVSNYRIYVSEILRRRNNTPICEFCVLHAVLEDKLSSNRHFLQQHTTVALTLRTHWDTQETWVQRIGAITLRLWRSLRIPGHSWQSV